MLTNIFCETDDFCKQFEKEFGKYSLTSGKKIRNRLIRISLSEIITLSIYYHHSGYKTFKDYYEKHVLFSLKSEFPSLVSYNRFLELKTKAFLPMMIFLQLQAKNKCTGISYIDSFSLEVSHPKRIYFHKTFKNLAKRGKTSVGWFYGFKLHLITNQFGEILSFAITPGNVMDNNNTLIYTLTKDLFGKFFGDKGYLLKTPFWQKLYEEGKHFVTKIRQNMKNKLMSLSDKLLLKKRGVIESVGAIFKEQLSLEHSRHRSILGFLNHVISSIAAYNFKSKKPSIKGFVYKVETLA